jgi:phospholipase/lecithinase/hemolysin
MYKLAFIATSAAIACGTLYSLPSQAATLGFDQIFTFGDSLSDPGNIYNLTKSLGDPFPPPPYAQRLSDGPVWVEYLVEDLGLDPVPFFAPTQGVVTDGINFALAGSTTGDLNTVLPSTLPLPPLPLSLQKQVGTFVSSVPPNVSTNALFVVWAGANDYLPTQSTEFVPFTTPDQTVDNLITAISNLMAVGAKNFLVPNLPDLGRIPLTSSSPAAESLNQLTRQHNQLLTQRLDQLSQSSSFDGKIISLDFNSVFDQALTNPVQFGFSNVTAPCLNQQASTLCSNPGEYLFWDPIHPTTKAHEILGGYAYRQLKSANEPPTSVPEPGVTLGLMALGAIGLGQKLRRAA